MNAFDAAWRQAQLSAENEELSRLEDVIVGLQLREVQGAALTLASMAQRGIGEFAFSQPAALIQQAIFDAHNLGQPTAPASVAAQMGLDEVGELSLRALAAAAPVSYGTDELRRNIDSACNAWLTRRRRTRIALTAAQVAQITAEGQSIPFDLIEVMERDRKALTTPAGAARFKLMQFPSIQVTTACTYLVKGWLPANGLSLVWGPPKCGKSFWTLDVALHIALGREYRSARVAPGPVVYIALEGAGGYGARVEAFRREHKIPAGADVNFSLLPTRLDLVADCNTLIDDIRVQMGEKIPSLIVVDTLNRSLAGSESSDLDMGAYIRAADTVKEALQSAVLIVHHCGVNDARPRGHTSLTGAVDAQLAVKRDQTGLIAVTLEWMKDGEEGAVLASRLKTVEVGQDDDGDAIFSCVMEPADAGDIPRKRTERKLTARQFNAVTKLTNLIAASGQPVPQAFQLPTSVLAVKSDFWKEELYRCAILDRDAANPRSDFKRLQDTLQARKIIAIRDGLVWLVQEPAQS